MCGARFRSGEFEAVKHSSRILTLRSIDTEAPEVERNLKHLCYCLG